MFYFCSSGALRRTFLRWQMGRWGWNKKWVIPPPHPPRPACQTITSLWFMLWIALNECRELANLFYVFPPFFRLAVVGTVVVHHSERCCHNRFRVKLEGSDNNGRQKVYGYSGTTDFLCSTESCIIKVKCLFTRINKASVELHEDSSVEASKLKLLWFSIGVHGDRMTEPYVFNVLIICVATLECTPRSDATRKRRRGMKHAMRVCAENWILMRVRRGAGAAGDITGGH